MHQRNRCAFSLIELLVVVSIIALLIAILLPALFNARTSANDATCTSNMGNLMKAQLAYVIDNDGLFPHYQEWIWGRDNLPDGTDFRQYARDYTTQEAPREGTLNTYVSDFNAHFCPIAPEMPINAIKSLTRNGPPGVAIGNKVVRSYVQSGRVHPEGYTLESVTKPAELLVLTEENTFSMKFNGMPGFKQHFGPVPMNDGQLNPVWDAIGSMHRRTDGDNLRSGYATGAFMDGAVDWVYSQAMGSPGNNATISFISDDLENPDELNPAFIDTSMDFSYTGY